MSLDSFPFFQSKVPVCNSLKELHNVLLEYPDCKFCLYLAYKDNKAWDISTSRIYMNKVLPNFIYLPVNIKKEDYELLREVYVLSQQSTQIIAINQTQPHKSNPVLKELFKEIPNVPVNIDAIVKSKEGRLVPYDLNGPSFVGWYIDEVGPFTNNTVVLIGVGGVGEPIARKVIYEKPLNLILISPSSKEELKDELSNLGIVHYFRSVQEADLVLILKELILINAAGKEGATDESGVKSLLKQFKGRQFPFIDLRPQLEIDIVEEAKQLGWNAYTGYGMNARNDYTLLAKIADLLHVGKPTFSEFKELVAQSS